MTAHIPWRSVPLGLAGQWLSGGTPSTSNDAYWGGDIPWISSGSLTSFRLTDSDRRVTSLGVKNGTRLVPKGAILIVVRGMSLKTEVRLGIAQRQVAFGQDCKALIASSDFDPEYLGYAMAAKRPELLELVDEAGHGTGRLNTDQLYAVEVPVPDLKEQRAIAKVFSALDDKIAANSLSIAKVDELAKTMWTLACKGGFEVPLSSLARFVNGKAFTKGASGTGRIVIRIAELNSGIGGSTVYNDIDVPEDHLARPGDLLFAWSGSLTVARWFREEAIVNQHIFKVIPVGDFPAWLVHQALCDKLEEFQAIAADKATTMGHIQRRHLDGPAVVPTRKQINRFDSLMCALWERALAAEQENLRLTSTRDQLLPLVISGKVRVQEAASVVEGVV